MGCIKLQYSWWRAYDCGGGTPARIPAMPITKHHSFGQQGWGLLKCYCGTGMLTQTLRIRRTLVSLAAERGYDTVAELLSVPNRPVHSRSFLGVLGRATPGKMRTGRTIADHSPSPWASRASQAEIIHVQTNHFHIVRHHSCRPRPSPEVPRRPPPALS